MAVASSDLEIAAGRTTTAASRYASQTPPTGVWPPPISSMASAGRTKRPLPIMADREIMTTGKRSSFLSKLPERSSFGSRERPSSSLGRLGLIARGHDWSKLNVVTAKHRPSHQMS